MTSAHSISRLCAHVALSRQGFYQGRRIRQRRAVDTEAVVAQIVAERQVQPRVGIRKLQLMLAPELDAMGVRAGRDRWFEIARTHDLLVPRRPRRARTTDSTHGFRVFDNVFAQTTVTAPHQAWVSDLTYLRTDSGFLYLSLITDAYSRQIVGYDVSDSLEAVGCRRALAAALAQLPAAATPLHHSDQGIQYCCRDYLAMLFDRQCPVSMTEQNHCYENAMAERVNGILKIEYLLGLTFRTKALAIRAVHQAVLLYNTRRLHTALGYRTPTQVHHQVA
jgi:putative transposase